MAKECTPGVVSPPVAATWIVLVNQLNASGVPFTSGGAVIFGSLQGKFGSSLFQAFQSPTKVSEEEKSEAGCHRGKIVSAFHWSYRFFRASTSSGWLAAKLFVSPISFGKL